MSSEAWVELALQMLKCNQKELALTLKVSPTQISKWKQREHISFDMQDKFRALTGIGEKEPQFVLWAGSLEDANKWEKLIGWLAADAEEQAETGYDTAPLHEDLDLLCQKTFYTLREMGVDLPKTFPKELDFDYEAEYDSDDEDADPLMILQSNPYSLLISAIFKAFTNVYGFFVAYLAQWVYDEELDLFDTASNIDACLIELAATKLEDGKALELATRFQEFRRRVRRDYKEWLTVAKETALRARIPLGAEIMDMVHGTYDALGHDAEAESLGINASRLHPDIYMNELLCGMRTIHQILPLIMKKLDIYDEFTLDESELRLS